MKNTPEPRPSAISPDERAWRAPNGFRIRVSFSSATIFHPSVRLMLCYQAGASDDPPGRHGLAHVVEHLIRNRTTRGLKGAPQVVIEMATTELDHTSFAARGPIGDLPSIVSAVHRMTDISEFSEKEVAAAVREVILEKKSGQTANPFAHTYDVLFETAFGKHPYGWYTIGRDSDLRAITARDCNRFVKRHYRAENAILRCVLFGTSRKHRERSFVGSLARLLETAVTHESAGSRAGSAATGTRHCREARKLPLQNQSRTRVIQSDAGSDAMVVGLKSLPPSTEVQLKIRLLLQCCKFMYERDRGPESFCFYESESVPARGPGISVLTFSRKPGFVADPHATLETLFDVFRRIRRGSITRAAFRTSRQLAIRECELLGALGADLNVQEAVGLELLDWREKTRLLRAVTPAELSRLARRLFRPERMTVVYSCSRAGKG